MTQVKLLKELHNYTDVFSEKIARELPSHTSYDYVINLVGRDLLKSLIYKLSEKKLSVLKEYLDNNLSKD